MAAGLNSTDFLNLFPEFSTVSINLINTYINMINFGFMLVTNNVTDTNILTIYYFLVAHYVSISTQPTTGTLSGPAGSYMPESESTGAVSASFAKIEKLSADESFMLSTRYGQVYWTSAKQQYIQNFYLNQCGWL